MIRTESGRRLHTMFRPSRRMPRFGITNCGIVGQRVEVDDSLPRVQAMFCKKCARGPVPRVRARDPWNPNEKSQVNEIKLEIIRRGIAEVEFSYRPGDPRRDGALQGFEITRWLSTPEEFELALNERRKVEYDARVGVQEDDEDPGEYWCARWCSLQIEHVYERMKVLWGYPIVSARATAQVAEILAQRREK